MKDMATNSHGDDDALDARVRSALEAPPHVVSRVVATARGAGTRVRPRILGLPRRAFAAAVSVLLVAGAVVGLMWSRAYAPVWESHLRVARGAAPRGLVTNEGDIIVIKMADRPITLIDPAAAMSPAPPGTMSIVLLGESK
jgi:hypothetical protein